MVLLTFATGSVYAQETTVFINNVSAGQGYSVIEPIMAGNVKNLGAGRINITYNSSVVHVTNVTPGTENALAVALWDAIGSTNSGWVVISACDLTEKGKSGDVIFANVTYKAVGAVTDISPLNISVDELFDINYIDIICTLTNGTFTVIPSPITPPVITITFPINGSTLGILSNSVIGCITSERELTVAKLTLNDDFVTTLNKGCFNVKVNYRANETNRIEVFARDKAGNANTSQMLVNVLPNIVVVNKTAIANRTIEITEAKNATNTAIELNATKTANVSVTINANTNASALNATPATSAYGLAQNQHSLEKYIDVNVTGIDRANLSFVSLYLYYTIADLDRNGDGDADDLGDLNETTLKMYWFNPNTSLWMPLGPGADVDGKPDYTVLGGPKVIDSERNKTEKYVKVTLNHFSTFALVAEKIPAPVTPTPTPLPEGGRGVGTPSPTSTLTPTLIPAEAPTLAPTVTPSVIPTQTSAPAIPTSPDVPFSAVKWLIRTVAIAIVASAIIVSAVYYHYL